MTTPAPRAPRVVLGTVESGINPYHPQFQDGTTNLPDDFVDATTGMAPIPLRLNHEGSFDERVQHDAALWQGVERGHLYWFYGTKILAMSLNQSSGRPVILDPTGHGTAVASTARNVSSDAWLVIVQFAPAFPGEGNDSVLAAVETASTGVAWLARQPWVDIITLSIGAQVDPPWLWEQSGFTRHTREAVNAGKVVVSSAGNLPTPTFPGGTAGPPWIIAVGGVEPSTHGEQPNSRKGVDVVSDFTRNVASWGSDRYYNASGTSFSAPVVAGVLAETLLSLRIASHHDGGAVAGVLCPCSGTLIGQHDLREALNASATYWNATEYDPLNYSNDPFQLVLFATVPILPAPWLQMGWGYVGPASVHPMTDLLVAGKSLPKPAAATTYMTQQQVVRQAYWGAAMPR